MGGKNIAMARAQEAHAAQAAAVAANQAAIAKAAAVKKAAEDKIIADKLAVEKAEFDRLEKLKEPERFSIASVIVTSLSDLNKALELYKNEIPQQEFLLSQESNCRGENCQAIKDSYNQNISQLKDLVKTTTNEIGTLTTEYKPLDPIYQRITAEKAAADKVISDKIEADKLAQEKYQAYQIAISNPTIAASKSSEIKKSIAEKEERITQLKQQISSNNLQRKNMDSSATRNKQTSASWSAINRGIETANANANNEITKLTDEISKLTAESRVYDNVVATIPIPTPAPVIQNATKSQTQSVIDSAAIKTQNVPTSAYGNYDLPKEMMTNANENRQIPINVTVNYNE